MTAQELAELKEARIESQHLGDAIFALETEVKEMDMEIRFLGLWKRWRPVGFLLSILFFAGLWSLYMGYIVVGNVSMEAGGYSGTAGYFLATFMRIFMLFFVVGMAVTTIIVGLKLYMEIGSSKVARSLAKKNKVKNYHERVDYCVAHKIELQRSIMELKEEKRSYDKRIDELIIMERPWDQN